MLHAAYLTKQGRSVACPGDVMFTKRKGAWDAESAHVWMKPCAEKNVGCMQRSRMYVVMEKYQPDEVDEFGKSLLELDLGWIRWSVGGRVDSYRVVCRLAL